jgi:hypothetical protein
MGYKERLEIIRNIEKARNSKVLCLLTSLRSNIPAQMAEDQVRQIYDHLLSFREEQPGKIPKIDVFLVSNGGSGTVPWRIVSLLREFSNQFAVLIPYRAYSAASLLALGADEILMHPFGEMGPIDPSVSNEYNPTDPITKQRLAISVEDVRAYVNFIKETVGITHEDELIKAVEALVEKVHPLALGNIERFISQSRMIAKKILKTHMRTDDERIIDDIIENMASKLYFHGHPINRLEAKEDLKLKVNTELSPDIEKYIWRLYLDYESEFENKSIFNPAGDLANLIEVTAESIMKPIIITKVYDNLLHAVVESTVMSCRFTTKRRYTLFRLFGQQGLQTSIQEDILEQGWNCSPAPKV